MLIDRCASLMDHAGRSVAPRIAPRNVIANESVRMRGLPDALCRVCLTAQRFSLPVNESMMGIHSAQPVYQLRRKHGRRDPAGRIQALLREMGLDEANIERRKKIVGFEASDL